MCKLQAIPGSSAKTAQKERGRPRTSFACFLKVSTSIRVRYFDIVLTTTAPTSFSRRFSRLSSPRLFSPRSLSFRSFRRRSRSALRSSSLDSFSAAAAASTSARSSAAFCAAAAAAMIAAVSAFVRSRRARRAACCISRARRTLGSC